jgi:hypothetical protein
MVAVLMLAGGVTGVIGSSRTATYFVQQSEYDQIAVPSCSIVLFAWTAWVGWGVWRGRAQFIRWAKILFALQVIVFNIGGIACEFFVGLSARIAVGGSMVPMPPPSHQLMLGANFGAAFNLHLTREDSQWMAGINVVALIVLVYLFRIPGLRPKAFEQQTQSTPRLATEGNEGNEVPTNSSLP